MIRYPCLLPLPSPILSPPNLLSAFVSFLRSSHLGALCVAALSLSPPLCSLSCLFQFPKAGTSRASVFGGGGGGAMGWGRSQLAR